MVLCSGQQESRLLGPTARDVVRPDVMFVLGRVLVPQLICCLGTSLHLELDCSSWKQSATRSTGMVHTPNPNFLQPFLLGKMLSDSSIIFYAGVLLASQLNHIFSGQNNLGSDCTLSRR